MHRVELLLSDFLFYHIFPPEKRGETIDLKKKKKKF